MTTKTGIFYFLICFTILYLILNITSSQKLHETQSSFNFNQNFIEAQYNLINVSDSLEMFRYVFNNLPSQAVIYPTENYYYFSFLMNNELVTGSLALPARSRDEGVLGFSYALHDLNYSGLQDAFDVHYFANGARLDSSKGVVVQKISSVKYLVTFENKTVTFILYMDPYKLPAESRLVDSEIFVGPVFDESGLRFSILFNEKLSTLYFILNKDYGITDEFDSITDDLIVGLRTGFVFFNDADLNRLILIGANSKNVNANNWYDGPFDQIPDNYIQQGYIKNYKMYLEKTYPDVAGKIDEYGNFLEIPGVRVGVAPYIIYTNYTDFEYANYCLSQFAKPELYLCLTRPGVLSK